MGFRISDLLDAEVPLAGEVLLEVEQNSQSRRVPLSLLLAAAEQSLATDLADAEDPEKGAALVGHEGGTVAVKLRQLDGLLGNKADSVFRRTEAGGAALTVDLKLKQIVHIRDFGGVGDNSTDNSAALANAIAAASVGGGAGEVLFGYGVFLFNSAVAMRKKVSLRGAGKGVTTLVRNFSPSAIGGGLLNLTQESGSSVRNMCIRSAPSTSGGCLISLIAAPTASPDFTVFEDIYLTYGSINSYENAIYINGSARSDTIGVRDVSLRDCDVFGGTTGTVYCDTAVNLRLHGSFFAAGSASGKITITASGANESWYIKIDAGYLDGLDISRCRYGEVNAAAVANLVTNAASARYLTLKGMFNSGYQNNWKDCVVIDSNAARTTLPPKSSRVEPDGTIINYDTISLTASWQTFTFSKSYASKEDVLALNGNCVAGSLGVVYFQNVTKDGYDAVSNAPCTAKIRAEGR